jgi:N-acylglucosamine 2-epimerase
VSRLSDATAREQLQQFYRSQLLDNIIPFWLRHGLDREHGGILTSLDRDGSILDTDKSVWFQGRAGWMFATLYNTVEKRKEWLTAALSCGRFSRQHCHSPSGKMWYSVTREGTPLRMRRYVYSESFAAISYAALAKATGDATWEESALQAFSTYLRYSFEPGVMEPKYEPTRPSKGIGAHMIGIVTAQEIRESLGDVTVNGMTCSQWIQHSIAEIRRDFFKPDLRVLMEVVGLDGSIVDHHDGRTLNPGHAIECAWFLMREGRHCQDPAIIQLGLEILDCMWERGWDQEHGGILYFRDVYGKPVQEYWQDMKFWWPHCEAIIATQLAWQLTGNEKYATMHKLVHDWSFQHFADIQHGEWYGYLHRDGTVAQPAKGNLYKGPFHLPRMLWWCWRELEGG